MAHPVPPHPPQVPNGFPPAQIAPPRKKRRTGLIITLVAVFGLFVCGGCGGGVWYFAFGGDDKIGAMTEDEPVYPQQYTPTVAPAPSGKGYGYIDADGPGKLCDLLDRERAGLVLPVTGSEPGTFESDDTAFYECVFALSNLDAFPYKGAEGELRVSVMAYTDPSLAEGDYAAALQEFAGDTALPVEGMDLKATAIQNEDSLWGVQTFVLATDGNMSITVAFGLKTVDDQAPAVPVEVLVGICVDFANEIAALAAKDE